MLPKRPWLYIPLGLSSQRTGRRLTRSPHGTFTSSKHAKGLKHDWKCTSLPTQTEMEHPSIDRDAYHAVSALTRSCGAQFYAFWSLSCGFLIRNTELTDRWAWFKDAAAAGSLSRPSGILGRPVFLAVGL